MSLVILTISVFFNCLSLSKNQPINVYPVLVGVGRVPYVESYVTSLLCGETVPPFASKVNK